MTTTEAVSQILAELPETRRVEVLDFARYLRWLEHRGEEERNAWLRFAPGTWQELYGPDDPEYTEEDIKRK